MTLGSRPYDPARDKQWSSEVYQKAKEVVEETLSAVSDVVLFSSLCEAVKRKHPSLCDDAIKDRRTPGVPYWKHLVASAIQALKKGGKVAKVDNGWVWASLKPPPPPPPDGPDKLAEEMKNLLEKLVELAKKGKEEVLPSHDELADRVKEMGQMLGKTTEGPWGPVYKHDCVWKDNPYANPKLVVEVCDKGNLDKDIASLLWAAKNWGAKGILVAFEESDFQAAQKKLAHESQICSLKAADMLKLHALLQAGKVQAIKSIFGI